MIRKLALELTQAAWANLQDPAMNSRGDEIPWCKLAVASLRFAYGIMAYEQHMAGSEFYTVAGNTFRELRAQAYHDNGTPVTTQNGGHSKAITIPVFPLKGHATKRFPSGFEGDHTVILLQTEKLPEAIKGIKLALVGPGSYSEQL